MRRAQTVVVVPSRTIEKFHEPVAETQAYEERLLCLLLGRLFFAASERSRRRDRDDGLQDGATVHFLGQGSLQ